MTTIEVDGVVLEYRLLPARRSGMPTLVLVHEGLGSVAMWRDFPDAVALATGCGTLVWSRQGYGWSSPLSAPRTESYLHDEALQRLPRLLAALDIRRPLLVGHSDGGSIALIYAAAFPEDITAAVVLAPHEFVEDKALAGIRRAGDHFADSDWALRLARYHRDPSAVFYAWHDTWLSAEFRSWQILDCLPAIRCPILAIQGENDEYATMRQIDCIAAASPDVELLKLPACRHSPQRDQPAAVCAAIARFVDRLAQR